MPQPADKSAKKYATGGVARACCVTVSKRVDGLDFEKAAIVFMVLERMEVVGDMELCITVANDATGRPSGYCGLCLEFAVTCALAARGCRSVGTELCLTTDMGWTDGKASDDMGPIRARTASVRRCGSDVNDFMMKRICARGVQ